jgi:predicted branched-subunit amino acid permease
MSHLSEARAGARAVAPMLLGVVPFGLVAGASPVAQGLGRWAAVGFSTIMFAGASQLAAIDVLGHGGSIVVAILTAWTINLRLVLYSASMAPFLAEVPTGRRLGAAYVLTDQAYAVSITRWARSDDVEHRLAYYLGAAMLLWVAWQLSTVAGLFVGEAVPDRVQLDFAVPLVFLVLLVPVLTTRPAIVAAVVGGAGAVLAAELGAGPLSVILGSALGIAAGAVVDASAGA